MTKTGRNELCHCGSGKKFKKCCGPVASRNSNSFNNSNYVISSDEYDNALDVVAEYYDGLSDHDDETDELRAQAAWFYLLYEPGTELGVPDSVFLPWLYFDVFFRSSKQTLSEKLIESPVFATLPTRTQAAINHFAESYPAFYKIVSSDSGTYVCKEIGTNRNWTVLIDEGDDLLIGNKDDLLYMRLLGSYDHARVFDAPWPISDESADSIENLVEARWAHAFAEGGTPSDEKKEFRIFNKTLSSFWVGYINGQIELSLEDDDDHFHLLNTEGHALKFCEVVFSITRKEELIASLTESEDFEYHDDDGIWIWTDMDEECDEYEDFLAPDIADLHIEGNKLVCNANSIERIERSRIRIEDIAGNAVSYEKIETQELNYNALEMDEPKPKEEKKLQ